MWFNKKKQVQEQKPVQHKKPKQERAKLILPT